MEREDATESGGIGQRLRNMVVNKSSLSVFRLVTQQEESRRLREAAEAQVPVIIYEDGKLGVASPMEIPVSDINDEADRFIKIIWIRRLSRNSPEGDGSTQRSPSGRQPVAEGNTKNNNEGKPKKNTTKNNNEEKQKNNAGKANLYG
ncbi:unnamed protein product [Musa textilis]